MPEMTGMLKTLKPDDKVSGSSQLARAIWALGWLGEPSSPADIARTIRARTALNWEGPQAAKFLRTVFETSRYASYFIRSLTEKGNGLRPRYLYDLTDVGRDTFKRLWTEGHWQPRGPEQRAFRKKDQTPEGIIRNLESQVRQLKEEKRMLYRLIFDLLNRIHSCHHGAVEATMNDIDAYMAGVKGEKLKR